MTPDIEQQPAADIRRFQEQKLKELLAYVNTHSAFYKKRFQEQDIDILKINTLDDLQQIPVTTKDDLNRHNFDFICVPKEKIIDYVTSSGTLGDPVTFALTDKDLERLAYNERISLACAGGTNQDIY
ncbi:MAG: phenylacetate--CoA ligase family protein, partial [Bacteroidia bacterium]